MTEWRSVVGPILEHAASRFADRAGSSSDGRVVTLTPEQVASEYGTPETPPSPWLFAALEERREF